MPLSRVYLKNLCPSATTYFKGASYYTDNRVCVASDERTEDGIRTVSAAIRGSRGQKYRASLTLSSDGEALTSCTCSCPAFASYNGICKHIVALALSIDSGEAQKPDAVRTDNAVMLMLRQYALKTMTEVSPSATGVKLVPTLNLSGQTPSVSFKIGIDRMYIIKDLTRFLSAIQNNQEHSYGKQFGFIHCLSAFDEQSARLVQFLLAYYNHNNYLHADGYYYGSGDRYRIMYLPPFMLEPFFNLYEERSISVKIGKKDAVYTVRAENPRLKLHIDPQTAGGYTMRPSKPFHALPGVACIYLIIDSIIYKCDSSFSSATREFFSLLGQAGGRQLTISKNDMPTLAATLLPVLSPYLSIVSTGDLSSFQPPALQSRVYFDMPSPELVTARLEHCYGEKIHQGFQNKDIRQSLDLKGESQIENLMLRYMREKGDPGQLVIRGDEKALYELAAHGVSEISQLAEVFATDAFKAMRVNPPAAVSVGVRLESDLLHLYFDVQGMNLAELEQVMDSYRQAKKYHRMRDGSFLNLEDSSLSEFAELAQGMDLTAKEIMSGELSVPKYRALYLDTLLKQSERIQYDRDSAFKRIVRDVRDVSDADYTIPRSLRHVLRNYQKTGYRWLRTLAAYGFGGILADDMGLGKTLQVIALLLAQKEEGRRISMVVCPSSLVLNWESEVRKFAPDLITVSVTGASSRREELIQNADGSADLLITSYDLLKRDVELYTNFSFQYVVADEAQYMKNQNTQNAKAMKTLRAAIRLALTGTPVENSLAEVWSIFDFLMPGYLYNYTKFRKSFETPIVKQNDQSAAKSLRKMVSPFILRRMKKDVLKELPKKIETVLYAELEGEQKKVYISNAAAAKKELETNLGDSGTDKLQILALLTRLRQICCDPTLVYENYTQGSAKMELCMELLQNSIESGHRILLFSQFTAMLNRIADRLDAAQIPYFTITGDTKVSQRLDLVNSFNDGDTPVFLISLKAGGTGLNIIGADVVIHYDPWWNNSAQNQASDRAHRIGQTKTVQVYKLITRNTLEERILEMQKNKSDLADMIVKEGDGAFARLSKKEILALFE